ncbi:AAA family ATPase [Clostridium butyricum]
MNLYVLIGLPGAGKSTYSARIENEHKAVVSSDDIRERLFGTGFNEKIKEEVFKELINESIKCLKKRMDIILDTTFLNEKSYRSRFIKQIDALDFSVKKIAVIMDTDIEECIFRDSKRTVNRRVGSSLIRRLHHLLVLPEEDEKFDLVITVNN